MLRHQMRLVSGQPCSSTSGKPPTPSRRKASSMPSRTTARSTAKRALSLAFGSSAIAAILRTTRKEERVDYEAARAGLEQAIPYNRFIGLEVVEVGEGIGVVR